MISLFEGRLGVKEKIAPHDVLSAKLDWLTADVDPPFCMEFDRMLCKSVLSSVISAVGLTVTLVAWTGAANAQTIDFATDGADPLSGAPNVRLSGFSAGEEVEVSFIRTPPDGAPPAYRSTARYRIDAGGGLSLSSRPINGD